MLCPKSVLITGSSRGIGLELVKHFARLEARPKFLFACCRTPDQAEIDATTRVGDLVGQFGVKVIRVGCTLLPKGTLVSTLEKVSGEATSKTVNAFEVLMMGGQSLPSKKTSSSGVQSGVNRKDELFNDVIDMCEKMGTKFSKDTCDSDGRYFVQELQAVSTENASVHVVQLDVTDMDSIKAAKHVVEKKLSGAGLNLLINSAAQLIGQNLHDVTKEVMMQLYEVNTVGPLMMAQTYLPLLKQAVFEQPDGQMSVNRSAIINISTGVASISENSSGGKYPYRCSKTFLPLLKQAVVEQTDGQMSVNRSAIINISSGVASISENLSGGYYPLRCSKAALNMVTSNLSIDLKPDGILCSAIHPGWVKTKMGGANALISTDESVTNIMTTMAKLHGEEETGKFYHAIQHRVLGW